MFESYGFIPPFSNNKKSYTFSMGRKYVSKDGDDKDSEFKYTVGTDFYSD